MEVKTSKIKEVINTKEWNGANGFSSIYHDLIMENGDKINLGKKTIQEVGAELSYKIIEGGQNEYQKSKPVNPDYDNKFGGSNKTPSTNNNMSKKDWENKDLKQATHISRQSALKAAIDFCRNQDCPIEHVLEQATMFHHWQMTGEVLDVPNISKEMPF